MNDNRQDQDRRQRLGTALRRLREEAGCTQKQLAERSGTDDTYISRVEHGRIDIGWGTLMRLLDALGSSLHQLAEAIDHQEQSP